MFHYAEQVAAGFRQPFPPHWPQKIRALIADCWHQARWSSGGQGQDKHHLALDSEPRLALRTQPTPPLPVPRPDFLSKFSWLWTVQNVAALIQFMLGMQNPAMRPSFSVVVTRLRAMQNEGLAKRWDTTERERLPVSGPWCSCCGASAVK